MCVLLHARFYSTCSSDNKSGWKTCTHTRSRSHTHTHSHAFTHPLGSLVKSLTRCSPAVCTIKAWSNTQAETLMFEFFIHLYKILRAWCSQVVCMCKSSFCEHNISESPWENFFTFCVNVHLDSGITFIDFSGRWSKINVTATSQNIFLSTSIMYLCCPTVPFLWTSYLRTTFWEFLQIWEKCPLQLKDALLRIWWQKSQR